MIYWLANLLVEGYKLMDIIIISSTNAPQKLLLIVRFCFLSLSFITVNWISVGCCLLDGRIKVVLVPLMTFRVSRVSDGDKQRGRGSRGVNLFSFDIRGELGSTHCASILINHTHHTQTHTHTHMDSRFTAHYEWWEQAWQRGPIRCSVDAALRWR